LGAGERRSLELISTSHPQIAINREHAKSTTSVRGRSQRPPLNRANARLAIFEDDEDYASSERVLAQAVARHKGRATGRRVNRPFGAEDEAAVRRIIERGQPFGTASWQGSVAARLGLESLFRPQAVREKRPNTVPDLFITLSIACPHQV
jgi:hypothetical protein